MKAVLLVVLCVAVVLAASKPLITQELVDAVNRAGKFQADFNKGSVVDGMTREQAKSLCGVKKGPLLRPPLAQC